MSLSGCFVLKAERSFVCPRSKLSFEVVTGCANMHPTNAHLFEGLVLVGSSLLLPFGPFGMQVVLRRLNVVKYVTYPYCLAVSLVFFFEARVCDSGVCLFVCVLCCWQRPR